MVEPRLCAVFVQVTGQERPKFIAEVTREVIISWDDTNCRELYGVSGKDLEAGKRQ